MAAMARGKRRTEAFVVSTPPIGHCSRMRSFTILEVRTGRIAPLGPNGVPSGIDKQPRAEAVLAGPDGLAGDEHGDPRRHGGPDKALHAYPAAHYPLWRADLPQQADRFRPGGFGENLAVDVTEADICLGDRFRIGGALVEVSQGRQPCWRLNLRFGRPDMARLVQETGRSGWYFRVLEPGVIRTGDVAVLDTRPAADWPLSRVTRLLYHDRTNRDDLAAFAALPALPDGWRRLAERRLASGSTEDWSARIDTPGEASR
jgi:MOSC domain-containing protein YiiM